MPERAASSPGGPAAVRRAAPADLPEVHALVEAVFALDVAPDLGARGRRTFRRTASLNALRTRLADDSLGWVARAGDQVVGYAERRGRHIHLLFVHPDHQRRGVGRALLAAARAGVTGPLTVNAAPAAVAAYARWGFEATGGARVRDGIVYVPMVMGAPPPSSP